jgi:hypothetical protein
MREFIKDKIAKLGCLFGIALVAMAATAVTKLILGWFDYDGASRDALSHQVGEYIGMGLLGLVVLLGFILMGRQFIAELRSRSGSARVPSPAPPPLPGRESPAFKKALAQQFEEFASGEINDIEGALALLQASVPEAWPRLHQALAKHQVGVLVHPDAAAFAPLSVNHPDGFRAIVVFTREAKAEPVLAQVRNHPDTFNSLKLVPFANVLEQVKPGEGIIINPADNIVRLDIPPDEIFRIRASIKEAARQNAGPFN